MKREKNIVIFGLVESNSNEKEKKIEHDASMVDDLFKTIKIRKSFIKRIHRFNNRNVSKESNNIRRGPVLVELTNDIERNEVLIAAKTLKDVTGKFEKVYINPDMSPEERILHKKLIKERNENNNQLKETKQLDNPYRYVIRDGTVKKIKSRNVNEGGINDGENK